MITCIPKKILSSTLCFTLLSIQFSQAALLDWDFRGSSPGTNGTGSGGGATLADATYIGNGTGTNEWNVGAGSGTSATNDNTLISNTFNSSALTGGFDVTVSVDASNQSQGYNETYPEGGVNYLIDSPAVGPYLDGGSDDALSLRIDSSSGRVFRRNTRVSQADLLSGAATWEDLRPETITIKIDPQNSVMSGATFNLYEIELLSGGLSGGDGEGNWDHERVVVTGFTKEGLAILPTLTQLVSGGDGAPEIQANAAMGVNGGSHNNPDNGINVKFDNTELDYIQVEYEMRRITDVGGYSFGLGLGDIKYDIEAEKVPEPTTPLLLSAAGLGLLLRRNRRD